jgi:hypothetical protein
VQQVRDLLECVWPAVLEAAAQPFKSVTWLAALTVVIERDGGDLNRTHRLGFGRFERAVRKEITRRGRTKPCLRIARKIFTALSDTCGVLAHRCGAFERIGWAISTEGVGAVSATLHLPGKGDGRPHGTRLSPIEIGLDLVMCLHARRHAEAVWVSLKQ